MNFMIEPCRFPGNKCAHMMCIECLKEVFKFNSEAFPTHGYTQAKCPMCRAMAFIRHGDEDKHYFVDQTYLSILSNRYPREYAERKEEVELDKIIVGLTFKIGNRLIKSADGVNHW